MTLLQHRVAALAVLAAGVAGVATWGRSVAQETPADRAVRDRLQGDWVATRVEASPTPPLEGPAAGACRATFDGHRVALRNLVGGVDAAGTYFVRPHDQPTAIDFKLDAGWVVGAYELADDGQTLALAVVPLAMSERMGVPARTRPRDARRGSGYLHYVFRRVGPA